MKVKTSRKNVPDYAEPTETPTTVLKSVSYRERDSAGCVFAMHAPGLNSVIPRAESDAADNEFGYSEIL